MHQSQNIMSTVIKKIVKKSLDLLKKEKKKHKIGTWLANNIYKKYLS